MDWWMLRRGVEMHGYQESLRIWGWMSNRMYQRQYENSSLPISELVKGKEKNLLFS